MWFGCYQVELNNWWGAHCFTKVSSFHKSNWTKRDIWKQKNARFHICAGNKHQWRRLFPCHRNPAGAHGAAQDVHCPVTESFTYQGGVWKALFLHHHCISFFIQLHHLCCGSWRHFTPIKSLMDGGNSWNIGGESALLSVTFCHLQPFSHL